MLSRLTDDEVQSSKGEVTYCDFVDEFFLSNEEVDESGIALFDEDNNVSRMYRCESKDESINTMKKVIAVCDLGEEEITKFDKVRHIIKGFLEICFRKKFTVFALSMAFIFMFFMGIKERIWAICMMYTWGFFTITETGKAIKFVKEKSEEYTLRDEALLDEEFMRFMNNDIDDSVDDIKLYYRKTK